MSPQTRKRLLASLMKYAAGALVGGAISGFGAYAAIGRDVSRLVEKQEAQGATQREQGQTLRDIQTRLDVDVLSPSELRELIRDTSPWTRERREVMDTVESNSRAISELARQNAEALSRMNELLARIDERVKLLTPQRGGSP